MTDGAMNICIYGASSAQLDPVFYSEAERLGRLIAENGHTLVFGGGKEGLMGAAARGAKSAGGRIIGIAPRFFDEPGILYEDCTEFIFTDTMRERKALLESRSDATVVLPGGIGTYEEFFELLTLKQLGQTDRAIVMLSTDGYFAPLLELLEHTAEQRFMSSGCLELLSVVSSPEAVIDYILSYKPSAGDIRRLSDHSK